MKYEQKRHKPAERKRRVQSTNGAIPVDNVK